MGYNFKSLDDDIAPGKPDISFYKKGKLMWLIDKTMAGKREYSLRTIKSYPDIGYRREDSYENYLNLANTDPRYKYNNWRLPTKDEMLSLVLKDTFWARLRATKEQKKSQRCIDDKIFYDDYGQRYWTTTKNKDGKYIIISYGGVRFKPPIKLGRGWRSSFGPGFNEGEDRRKVSLRLVRDVK